MFGRLLAIWPVYDFIALLNTQTGEAGGTKLASWPSTEKATSAILPKQGSHRLVGARDEKESEIGLEHTAQASFLQSNSLSKSSGWVPWRGIVTHAESTTHQRWPFVAPVMLTGVRYVQHRDASDPRAARSTRRRLRSTRRQSRSVKKRIHGRYFPTSCHGYPLRRPAGPTAKRNQEFLWRNRLECLRKPILPPAPSVEEPMGLTADEEKMLQHLKGLQAMDMDLTESMARKLEQLSMREAKAQSNRTLTHGHLNKLNKLTSSSHR